MMASKFDSPQKADRQRRSNRCDFTRNLGTPPLIFTHSACSARFRTKPVPGLARQGLCRVFRVEVTTGHRTSTGRLTRPIKDGTRFDVLVVVLPESIGYFTDLPELIGLVKLQTEIVSAVARRSVR